MKSRQSTTRPISWKMTNEIARYMELDNCGVMLRYDSKDVGICRIGMFRGQFHCMIDNSPVALTECRIKALTIQTIRRMLYRADNPNAPVLEL